MEKGDYPKIIISSKIAKKLEANINDTILFSFARELRKTQVSLTQLRFQTLLFLEYMNQILKSLTKKYAT